MKLHLRVVKSIFPTPQKLEKDIVHLDKHKITDAMVLLF